MSPTQNPKTKKKIKGRKSNATKLAHKKFRWLRQLSVDPRLPPLSLRTCIQISDRANLDHGGIIVGQDTLAKELGVRREAVNRALRQAIALGHLEAIRRGRDHANAYRIVLKDEAQATSEAPHDVRTVRTSSPNMMCASEPFDVRYVRTQTSLFSPGPLTEAQERRERSGR